MATRKSTTRQQPRYFLLTTEMLISEEFTKVLIAKNAEDAKEKVIEELVYQDLSDWDYQGQDIKSAYELRKVCEVTKKEFDDYIATH